MADASSSSKTPWHLWVVGGVSLIWNGMGVLDFTMTQMRDEAWLKTLTPEQVTYFTSIPMWVVIAWACGTYGSFFGSIMLLMRRKFAPMLFTISAIGAILTDVYTYGISDGFKIMKGGAGLVVFSAIILVIIVLLRVYAVKMARRGVLR